MFSWFKNIFKTKPIKKRIISDDEYNSIKYEKFTSNSKQDYLSPMKNLN